MKVPVCIFSFLLCSIIGLAQPGPEVFYKQNLRNLNEALEKDPENDALRLQRIGLHYQEDKSMSKSDIDYLFRKFEAGTNSTPLDYARLYALYGACYQYSNPKLATTYYRKAADLKPSEYVYNQLYNNYVNLRIADTAQLYYDTLVMKYGLNLGNDYLSYKKIELMDDPKAFNPKLEQFYQELSRTHFNTYLKERSEEEEEKEDYTTNILIENGFDYQFDLCDYYLRWHKTDLAKKTLKNLKDHIGKNVYGEPVALHVYHRYYFLMGTILEKEGKSAVAIPEFLYASDYMHYKDTLWSSAIMQKYPRNTEALVLHAQICYNQQKADRWQNKDPEQRVLDLFRQAKKAGSTNYRIFLAEAAHFLFLKDYQKALEQVDLAIAAAPNQSAAYEQKVTILREAYWHEFISEERLEKEVKELNNRIRPLLKNVITSVPKIALH